MIGARDLRVASCMEMAEYREMGRLPLGLRGKAGYIAN